MATGIVPDAEQEPLPSRRNTTTGAKSGEASCKAGLPIVFHGIDLHRARDADFDASTRDVIVNIIMFLIVLVYRDVGSIAVLTTRNPTRTRPWLAVYSFAGETVSKE